MSHFFLTRHHGHKVIVRLGYDRVLKYVYMTTIVDDKEPDDARYEASCAAFGGEGIVYSNLDDKAAGDECVDVNFYRRVLNRLGIVVPESMFTETLRDQQQDSADRNVEHFLPGAATSTQS